MAEFQHRTSHIQCVAWKSESAAECRIPHRLQNVVGLAISLLRRRLQSSPALQRVRAAKGERACDACAARELRSTSAMPRSLALKRRTTFYR